MASERVDPISDTLKRAVEALAALAADRVQSVTPRPVLPMHPPESRESEKKLLNLTVEELGTIANACREVREDLDQILAKVERAKQDCQRALTPACSLPTELLSYILELAVMSQPDGALSPAPKAIDVIRITHVCTVWRRAARACSAFWTTIPVHQRTPFETLHDCVPLSNGKSLHVTVFDRVPILPLDMHGLPGIRFENVAHLSWSSMANPYDVLVGYPSPCLDLKSFHLEPRECDLCGNGMMILAPKFFHRIDFPQLQELFLKDVDIPGTGSINAPQLTSLRLNGVSITMDAIADMLEGLPTLETLELYHLRILYMHDHADSPIFQIPNLRSLTTGYIISPTLRHFLVPHRYPALRQWKFMSHNVSEGDPEVRELLRTFLEGSRSLESITVQSGRVYFESVLLALKSNTKPSCAPALKLLDLSAPPKSRWNTLHETSEDSLLDGIAPMLRRRKKAKLPMVEKLVLRACFSDDPRIVALEKLVTEVVVEDCKVMPEPLPEPSSTSAESSEVWRSSRMLSEDDSQGEVEGAYDDDEEEGDYYS